MLKPFQSIFAVLGCIPTIMSLVSLIQNWGDIELATIPEEALAYYRELASSIKSIMFDWWFPVTFPNWLFDVFIVWTALFSATVRMAMAADEHWLHMKGVTPFYLIFVWLFAPLLFLRSVAVGASQFFERSAGLKHMDPSLAEIPDFIAYERRMMMGGLASMMWAAAVVFGVPAFFLWSAISQ